MYKPEEIIDLRSSVHTRAEEVFTEAFMKYAQPVEKEAAAAPGGVRPEDNENNNTSGTNHIGLNAKETKGAPTHSWGQVPPPSHPSTTERSEENQSLSTSAEEVNTTDNHELLVKNFDQMVEAIRKDKELIRQNFATGKPGEYETRSQTLLERVRGTAGRT